MPDIACVDDVETRPSTRRRVSAHLRQERAVGVVGRPRADKHAGGADGCRDVALHDDLKEPGRGADGGGDQRVRQALRHAADTSNGRHVAKGNARVVAPAAVLRRDTEPRVRRAGAQCAGRKPQHLGGKHAPRHAHDMQRLHRGRAAVGRRQHHAGTQRLDGHAGAVRHEDGRSLREARNRNLQRDACNTTAHAARDKKYTSWPFVELRLLPGYEPLPSGGRVMGVLRVSMSTVLRNATPSLLCMLGAEGKPFVMASAIENVGVSSVE